MNEEHLIGVFRKALVAARADAEARLGRSIRGIDVAQSLIAVGEIERFDTLLRSEKWLRDFAKELLSRRLGKTLGDP